MRSKYFHYLFSLVGLIFSIYCAYLAIYSDEGVIASLFRGIGAITWLYLSITLFKERNISRKEWLINWLNKEKPKGVFYHLFYIGMIRFGLTVGFLTLVSDANISDEKNLLKYAIRHMIIFLLGGILFGWMVWKGNNKESIKLGLEDSIE